MNTYIYNNDKGSPINKRHSKIMEITVPPTTNRLNKITKTKIKKITLMPVKDICRVKRRKPIWRG